MNKAQIPKKKDIILNVGVIFTLMSLVVMTVFKIKLFVLVSNSMSPSLSYGDLLIVVPQQTYHIGDIVSFAFEGKIVTHRIVGINTDVSSRHARFKEQVYYNTKGDANLVPDPITIENNMIMGKSFLLIPRFVMVFVAVIMGICIYYLTICLAQL